MDTSPNGLIIEGMSPVAGSSGIVGRTLLPSGFEKMLAREPGSCDIVEPFRMVGRAERAPSKLAMPEDSKDRKFEGSDIIEPSLAVELLPSSIFNRSITGMPVFRSHILLVESVVVCGTIFTAETAKKLARETIVKFCIGAMIYEK